MNFSVILTVLERDGRDVPRAEIDASHAERDVNIKGQVRPKMNIINIIYSTSHAEGSHLQYCSPQTFLELQGKQHHSILLKN